jgi:hypothetical protein
MTALSTPELNDYEDRLDRDNEDWAVYYENKRDEQAIEEAVMAADNDRFTVGKEEWEEILAEIEKTEGGKYLFPEKGNTRIRILLYPERTATEFYQEVVTVFKDKARTRYMFPVLVADDNLNFTYEVRLAVVAKTVLQEIMKFFVAGYDFLHPAEGLGLTIVRSGEGLGTKYSVIPSKSPIPVDYKAIEFEKTLSEVAEEFVNNNQKDKETKVDEDFPF